MEIISSFAKSRITRKAGSPGKQDHQEKSRGVAPVEARKRSPPATGILPPGRDSILAEGGEEIC